MHVAVRPPARAFVPDTSHNEGLVTPQLVDERVKNATRQVPCEPRHERSV